MCPCISIMVMQHFSSVHFLVDKAAIAHGDTRYPLKFCPTESTFFCVSGSFFNFAVPKAGLTPDSRWRFEGKSYSVQKNIIRSIPGYRAIGESAQWNLEDIGKDVSVFIIHSTPDEEGMYQFSYLYSYEKGLVGFSITSLDPENLWNRTYWNTEKFGLGYPEYDKYVPNKSFFQHLKLKRNFNDGPTSSSAK